MFFLAEEASRKKKEEEEARALEEKKRRKQERKKRKLELKEARAKEKAQKEMTVSSEVQSCDQDQTSDKIIATEKDVDCKDKIPSDTGAEDCKSTDGGLNQALQKEDMDASDDIEMFTSSTDALERKDAEIVAGEHMKLEDTTETNRAPNKEKDVGNVYELVEAKFP